MEKQLRTITLTILSLLSIGLSTEVATASTLFMGKNSSLNSENSLKIADYNLASELSFLSASSNEMLTNLSQINSVERSDLKFNPLDKIQVAQGSLQQELAAKKPNSDLATTTDGNFLTSALLSEIQGLQAANYYEMSASQVSSTSIVGANEINQSIQGRYQNLVESDSAQMNLLLTRKLLAAEPSPELANQAGNTNLVAQQQLALLTSGGLLETIPQKNQNVVRFPKSLLAVILLLIGWRGYYVLKALGNGGIFENLLDKYGNPQVPENAVALHNRNFKQLTSLGSKVAKIAKEKFGSEEFMLYLKLRQQVEKGVDEYKNINQSIQYLEVAIATQSSFLKLEQTESRYRSRKQQEFYNFVAETVAEDLDKDVFRNTLKRKLAEIVPLLNSEEGRTALQSYIKEITKISQHNLGLKLFSLFKQHNVTNFTILAKVADIVKKIQAEDLLTQNNLVVIILENYDVFENLAPIIDIKEDRVSPETFAILMQYMGLVHRHENAMSEFASLSKGLKQWHKPYKSLMTIRQQYPESEYRLPQEFVDKIPGMQIFKKYEKYIFDN